MAASRESAAVTTEIDHKSEIPQDNALVSDIFHISPVTLYKMPYNSTICGSPPLPFQFVCQAPALWILLHSRS